MSDQADWAHDSITIAPEYHQQLYEDEHLRIVKVTIPPGSQVAMHWHPQNYNHVLQGGRLRIATENSDPTEVTLLEGQVLPSGPVRHAVVNIGETTVSTLEFELK